MFFSSGFFKSHCSSYVWIDSHFAYQHIHFHYHLVRRSGRTDAFVRPSRRLKSYKQRRTNLAVSTSFLLLAGTSRYLEVLPGSTRFFGSRLGPLGVWLSFTGAMESPLQDAQKKTSEAERQGQLGPIFGWDNGFAEAFHERSCLLPR